MNIRIISAYILAGLLVFNKSYAQDRPVGYWRSHLPYNKAVSIATDGTTLFVAAESSFYTINESDGTQETYSKVEGMADVGLSCLAYDVVTNTTVIAYKNGNIDLFKEGSFFNIPYLKLKTVTGSKNVNNIYTINGLAYLSTDIGIIVLNLNKREVKESYTFVKNNETIPVVSFSAAGNYFFAATPIGLYRTNRNSASLQSFDTWTILDSTKGYVTLAARNDTIYTATIDTAFAIEGSSTVLKPVFYSDSNIAHINSGVGGVWIIENYDTTYNGKLWKMDGSYSLIDSFNAPGFNTTKIPTNFSEYQEKVTKKINNNDDQHKYDNFIINHRIMQDGISLFGTKVGTVNHYSTKMEGLDVNYYHSLDRFKELDLR